MQTITILGAAKSEFSSIKLDVVLGMELVHGDLTDHAVIEHFWLIDSKAILEEDLLWRKRDERRGRREVKAEQKFRWLSSKLVFVVCNCKLNKSPYVLDATVASVHMSVDILRLNYPCRDKNIGM